MKSFNLAKFLPCAVLFANGRTFGGVIALLMQATIVFWPVASRWAFQLEERKGIEALLDELSEADGFVESIFRGPVAKIGRAA
ncbi:hypothetical protein [Acidocella aromatica]|uniref:Uncharacterized protein n=1 Tax=Acidocella aromatica TaxID=1303579 RepID=A0A840VAU0_9PROT|nr:hypothetical protein [Acidocella aromatica]MBB5371947.1 hypothetical protein [Acidocella aromatica]